MKHLKNTIPFIILLTGIIATSAEADLAGRIEKIINQPSQKKVRFSICVAEAETGRIKFRHNANQPFVPASNMKLIITAAAVEFLGPDFEYKTQAGLCDNNLVIIGSGDPLLGDEATDTRYGRQPGWIFEDIIAKLKNKKINTVKDIIVDSSIFDAGRVHPNWPVEQLNRWYACEISGINFNGNCIEITTENVNGKVTATLEPDTNFVHITNNIRATSTGKGAVGAYRQPGRENHLILKGRCKNRQVPFKVAIERPAAFFGYLLAENLADAGIKATGRLIEKAFDENDNFELLAEYKTPLADCLSRCNKNSFQLAAESLLKTIGAKTTPNNKNGSWELGRQKIHNYLSRLGIASGEFYVDDGSGLSEQNRLSANAITKTLLNVYAGDSRTVFINSLASGGTDGTISRYFGQDKYKGRILGKTGYIMGVKSFSGICTTDSGDYIFSILANGANGNTRGALNDIAKAVMDEYAQPKP